MSDVRVLEANLSDPEQGERIVALIDAQAARDRGCAKLTLEVLAENPRAQGLYKSFGFQAHAPGSPEAKTFFFAKKL